MNDTRNTRREFLTGAAAFSSVVLGGCTRQPSPSGAASDASAPTGPADVTLRIGTVLADIAKEHVISTIGYNGTVPGPLIRLREGVPVTVDLFNDTGGTELVHWHGQIIPAAVDGAAEEKSLDVPAHGHIRCPLPLPVAYARTWGYQSGPVSAGVACGPLLVAGKDNSASPFKVRGPGSNLADHTLLEVTAGGELIIASSPATDTALRRSRARAIHPDGPVAST